MPSGFASIEISTTPPTVFDLLHDYRRRLDWDPFLRDARLLKGAQVAGVGVTSCCVARRSAGGMAMETIYISFARPGVAAVKMTRGPIIFRTFAASIRQEHVDDNTTRVTYRYKFELQPRWLAPLLEPVVRFIFDRETRQRLIALKQFLEGEGARD
ncbi:type II toxin-antitoxin system RatA family toxin [Symmachiella dynata]|uniref:type II toxin-antitoxin system RatA family toxin n=1 Tax=Symmachiella dynata TaxID=2527995 RepID=UPI0030EBBAA1